MVAKLTISYDGSDFYGSQYLYKNGSPTHETVLNKIESVLVGMGIDSKISAAGRTDRGVHALAQVVSFEVPIFWQDSARLKKELVKKLIGSIDIKKVEILGDDFNARFSAKSRSYRYLISTKKISIFTKKYITFVERFDLVVAKEAIKIFEGTHDFFAFSKRGSDEKSTIRTIYKTSIYQHNDLIVLNFEANSFLRSQIRMMVGAIIEVANNQATLEDIKQQLIRQKTIFKNPANAGGLYLSKVKYF